VYFLIRDVHTLGPRGSAAKILEGLLRLFLESPRRQEERILGKLNLESPRRQEERILGKLNQAHSSHERTSLSSFQVKVYSIIKRGDFK